MKALGKWLMGGLIGIIALALAVLWVADTGVGHRFIVDQIAAQTPKSGLRIRIGRIEGSIYNKARLRGVRLFDADGLFFDASEIELDWSPQRWMSNRLQIKRIASRVATLHKLPRLKPGDSKGAILPSFDIHIGALEIDTLRIASAVSGTARTGRVTGMADIISSQAKVTLNASTSAGDSVALRLDAAPDDDRFDLDLKADAPASGVLGAIAGTKRPFNIAITGDGGWKNWRGKAVGSISGARIADLSLANDSGTFALDGRLALASITKGKLQRLTTPLLAVSGSATFANRRIDGAVRLQSAALRVDADGMIDLATSRYNGLNIKANLLQSRALFPNMTGGPLTMKAMLDGAFATARFDYLLSAPRLNFDQTGFENIRASGRGYLSKSPVRVPVRLTASRVTGVGNVAGGILANLIVTGELAVTAKTITGDMLKLVSDKLNSRLTLVIDLATGRYDVGFAGELQRYAIPGLGIVDVKTDLKVIPGPAGKGSIVAGRGQAWVRRLDNAFLASLTQGLPRIETGLVRGIDGVMHFNGLRLIAPGITLTGNGIRRRDGSFQFEASGRQARYGPIVKLILDGRIERPRVDVLLSRPNDAMGLTNVRAIFDPVDSGYVWRAAGGSRLGNFTGNGTLALPPGAAATINFAALDVSGLRASGALVSRTGGFDGRLAIAGNGVSGTLDFAPVANIQRIEAHLSARAAQFAGPPLITAQRGKLDAVMLLDPAGTTIDATITGQGLARGGISLARLAANIKMRGGVGEVKASFAGSRGRAFDLQTVAQIAPDRLSFVGSGTIDRRPVRLTAPATIVRERGGWRLSPTQFEFAGGKAEIAGLFGGADVELDAKVSQLPLTVLEVIYPGLGLGGSASGTVTYRTPVGGLPSGRADLRVRGLTRSGLIVTSEPVDVAVAAVLSPTNAAARAIAMSKGQVIGRGQIKLSPSGGGDLNARLSRAPMAAQLRFNGAGSTLWRLTGIEAIDLSGPVAIGADINGTVNDPRIVGSLRTTDARIESSITGMVLTGVKARGRFGGSSLVIDDFTATSGKDGSVTGRGNFDLSSARGFAMDLAINATRATLIARDELGATVSGPVTIKSDADGGLISGEVTLDRSSYRLGRAAATVAAIAQLNVEEINATVENQPRRRQSAWRLAIKARAPARVKVTGLGIDSEWRANLDIGGTATSPAIRGQADLVRGGYEFAGRRFDLARGSIRFQGESPPDPILDIVANGDTQGLNATIRMTGTGQRPEIAFSSTPALPQDELLSRLLFGTSITNLSAPEALQLASAVASLQGGGNGLNPINALRNAIGLDRLRILPADTTTGQGTAIAAGKYLTRRAYFEVITDGQGYSATRAEFQITRWLSLLSTISSIGRQSATLRISKDY